MRTLTIPVVRLALMLAAPLLAGALAAADGLPLADPAAAELHGRLRGEPFWARLQAADPKFGNKRVLQLVYTPPSPEALGGAHLSDCPFVLLDDRLCVAAWNDRDSAASALAKAKTPGYAINRDLLVGDGDAKHSEAVPRSLPGAVGWDLHLAPVQLALCWKAGEAGEQRVVDLFGPRWQEEMTIAWHGLAVTLAGQALTATADGSGRLKSLVAADGSVLIDIAGRP
jgi:hypothetical protein